MGDIEKRFRRKLHTFMNAYQKGGIRGAWEKCKDFVFRHAHEYQMQREIGYRNNRSKRADDYVPYSAEYQENRAFSEGKLDVKALAFYLPQFHTFPENDAWWGEGFTEWVNTRKAEPRFEGHYQPRTPHEDIGYYDLSDINVLAWQSKLAKEHGIYGFCFYYYWFSGKRLMEKPVDMLLEHPEIDIPFCLCWANENWTRAWDGQNRNVLIKQDYSDEDDERFIIDLKKYIDDSRYIRVYGKPVIVVYNPAQIPSCEKSFSKWREVARRIGIGEILIWTCATAENCVKKLGIAQYVDAEVEFPPHNMYYGDVFVQDLNLHGKTAMILNYQQIVEIQEKRLSKQRKNYPVPVHYACTMGWDNAARRKENWMTYYAFSLEHLYRWMRAVMKRAREDFKEEERFVFINAWNEWAEGTYLEPDEKYGYANINTVSKALFDQPFEEKLRVVSNDMPLMTAEEFEAGHETPRIAAHVHMFYPETMDSVLEALSAIPYRYDCYMSTDTPEKKAQIEKAWKDAGNDAPLTVEITPNRGRDVAPFIMQMTPVLGRYDYICHIHSKKTVTGDYGDAWRTFNFRHLLGGKEYVGRLFSLFEREKKLGIAFPETYPAVAKQVQWGGNRKACEVLLEKLGIEAQLPVTPVFPVGNMFWARREAVQKMFCGMLTYESFPEEGGQKDATIAHAIERSWVYLAQNAGYRYARVFNNCDEAPAKLPDKKRLVLYAHYDRGNTISDDDVRMIQALRELGEVVFATNNADLPEDEQKKIVPYVRSLYLRENKGFDFGAWRESMVREGFENLAAYDEVILANNSMVGPVFPLARMFEKMEKRHADFWGTYLFPYSKDGSYIGESCIPEHLQSYFVVFNQKVVRSEAFRTFWQSVKDYKKLIDVVKHCETKMTKTLADAGFSYAAYIEESAKLGEWLNSGSVPYTYPDQLLLLGMPFYKKKAEAYMDDKTSLELDSVRTALERKV